MKITNIEDYFNDRIKFLHPYLKKEEFKRIMEWGFNNYNLLTKKGADMFIKNWRYRCFCGKMYYNRYIWLKYMYLKHVIKLRLLSKYNGEQFDGVYYFGLTDDEYGKYGCLSKTRRKLVKFNNITLYKIKEECFLNKTKTHFFEAYYPLDLGWAIKQESFSTRNFREIAFRDQNNRIIEK